MRSQLAFLLALGLSLSGCTKQTWNRTELVDWYLRFGSDRPKVGYCGSDDRYHYFASRPIDSFVSPRVTRSQIIIADERSHSSLGRRIYFYLVDPSHDFAKVAGSDVAE